jgi:hypothetical protein
MGSRSPHRRHAVGTLGEGERRHVVVMVDVASAIASTRRDARDLAGASFLRRTR